MCCADRIIRKFFLAGLDPTSIAGMAAAAAVAGEYPPPGAGSGPPEFLTGPMGQSPQVPGSGGSPAEFLAPSGKILFHESREYYCQKGNISSGFIAILNYIAARVFFVITL